MAIAALCETVGAEVSGLHHLCSGQIGEVYRAVLDGREVIIKTDTLKSGNLLIEARMLQDLAYNGLRVPEVLYEDKDALVLEYIFQSQHGSYNKELEAAKALSVLHSVGNDSRMYGYYYDTPIASFIQKNEQTQYNWALFLAQMRILPMAKTCYDRGMIDANTIRRIEALCCGLHNRIDLRCITPSLLHGDVWGGNVLYDEKGVCFIDPAIYFGDREMELAFITLFNTFGKTFFDTYTKTYPLSSDFYETKVPLYQIYPLLVHTALYGGGYVGELEERLQRLKV